MASGECLEAAKEALEVSIDEGGAANAIILLYICMKQPSCGMEQEGGCQNGYK